MTIVYVICFVLLILVFLKLYYKINQVMCSSKVCLVGKTAVVTGGSSGIGYQVVLGLASRGCRIIIADLNIDEEIKDKIYKETRNPNIILKYINLGSFKSVREFAAEIEKTEAKIDILVNNAGIGQGLSAVTEDGLNLVMQVNYYSAFLLTHLLLDLLKKSDFGGRIIFTTSLASLVHTLTADSVRKHGLNSYGDNLSYITSKFCQICASETFAEKLRSHGITSNCFHPHMAQTNIFSSSVKSATWYMTVGLILAELLANLVGKSAEEAAQTGIFLACANEVKGTTGGFFGETKPSWKPFRTTDPQLMKALWEDSETNVKLKPEEKI